MVSCNICTITIELSHFTAQKKIPMQCCNNAQLIHHGISHSKIQTVTKYSLHKFINSCLFSGIGVIYPPTPFSLLPQRVILGISECLREFTSSVFMTRCSDAYAREQFLPNPKMALQKYCGIYRYYIYIFFRFLYKQKHCGIYKTSYDFLKRTY